MFVAVSGPLTMLTIIIWYAWTHFQKIVDMVMWKRERQARGFTECVEMLFLLRKIRELPR